MKAVKSTDVRKPAIMAAFKKLTGATKVTNVREDEAGFYADVLSKVPNPDTYYRNHPKKRLVWGEPSCGHTIYKKDMEAGT